MDGGAGVIVEIDETKMGIFLTQESENTIEATELMEHGYL
jgi:hypothetical protein